MSMSGAWENGMLALMLALKKATIMAEAIPVHMNHKQTAIENPKYKLVLQQEDGCCRPMSIYEVWRYLGLSQHRVEQLSRLQQEVYI